jgi:hypothetical protein
LALSATNSILIVFFKRTSILFNSSLLLSFQSIRKCGVIFIIYFAHSDPILCILTFTVSSSTALNQWILRLNAYLTVNLKDR